MYRADTTRTGSGGDVLVNGEVVFDE